MAEQVVPYKGKEGSKKEQVAQMFDNISARYDFLNHFLSLGIDKLWRKKAVKLLKPSKPQVMLDVATGTADFALAASKLQPRKIYGIDISGGMLEVGRKKIQHKGKSELIELAQVDSENMPFESNYFDAITVGFGVRNFENLEKGLAEMYRVLKKDGTAMVLEFSKPSVFPVKQLYGFYFKRILPFLGRRISKDKAAYSYLPESVDAFPEGKAFTDILEQQGFTTISITPLMFGIASIYAAKK